ncbi:MAG: glycosyltransferase family 39 protein [Thaumarchaeota archaeon]|nr:glycosyltransferase family 39 protein [Nitrososphaerota archaeon]MBI3641095.1 glycosyltransferase family 39 protein [Nitrososphaerota archaeon]
MKINRVAIVFLIIPLALSAFTHLWNPIGFPDIFYDEGVYMYRAMNVLAGQGPQTNSFHDHPFFGQLFLAGTLSLTGYPDSLHPKPDVHSIEMLYLVPRVLMGLLAVVDTFLIFKISERRYSTKVAFLASILFAVMPVTWLMRRILLDSLLLPFLLSSILFAIYAKDSQNKKLFAMLSGVLLGIAIFTKETAFVMIPLVVILLYQSTKDKKILLMWIIPVILIPMLWPIQSIEDNQFHKFVADVLTQVHRQNNNFVNIIGNFAGYDPVLLILGITGTVYAAIKRDSMILLWIIPFVIFLASLGYVQYFYWILILPAFCIAASKFIIDKIETVKKSSQRIITFSVIASICIFGLTISTLLITTNVSGQFEAAAYVVQNVHNSNISKNSNNTTIISSPEYSWLFTYVYKMPDVAPDYRYLLFYPAYTEKILLISDTHFRENINAVKQLQDVYNHTFPIKKFYGGVLKYDIKEYPFTNMVPNYEGSEIEIRENK